MAHCICRNEKPFAQLCAIFHAGEGLNVTWIPLSTMSIETLILHSPECLALSFPPYHCCFSHHIVFLPYYCESCPYAISDFLLQKNISGSNCTDMASLSSEPWSCAPSNFYVLKKSSYTMNIWKAFLLNEQMKTFSFMGVTLRSQEEKETCT